jgi:anti-sigma factor RsiW
MKHVTDRLAAWLGDELEAAEAAALAAHLEVCADCRREAAQARADWALLEVAAVSAAEAGAARAPAIWPAVRARTFGRETAGWFFGRSPATRMSLAVATVAIGVLCGRLTGSLSGPANAVADDDSGLAAVWLEESSWHDESSGGLADTWLALAGTDDVQAGAEAQGGTK